MKKYIFTLYILLGMLTSIQAQTTRIYSDDVKTLTIIANNNPLLPPIINLGGNNHIDVGFDLIGYDTDRLMYRIEHCNSDWTPSSEIFESDFLEGFNNQFIEDMETSFNTNLHYTHYRLRIPNENMKMKISGNYKIHVYTEENEEYTDTPLFTACFSIVEPAVGISATISSNTDIDFNKSHQQITFAINYNGIRVIDPVREFKTLVMQNRRTDNWAMNPTPNIQKSNSIEYTHQKSLIFKGGNEFHKFEILGFNRANMNVEQIKWVNPYYHAVLYMDKIQKNYIYETDQNGARIIRNLENVDNNTSSEYCWVHFQLKSPQPLNGDVYISGQWTYNNFSPEYKMQYKPEIKAYETALLLKQGYYNYQYILVNPQTGETDNCIDGDFFQTENEYIILVYHRANGSRYDRLVGYKKMNYSAK